jgi:RNA polymerase sigma-70 factor, ECF subfamily
MVDWNRIVKEHGAMVFRVAWRILGTVEDAEDVAQDVFCEAYELHVAQRVESWKGLLGRMATLRAVDRLRRTRRTVPLDESSLASRTGPSEEAIARELAERLRSAVARLPDQQAAVFSLSCLEALPRYEVAETLGISPAAVSTALFKARQKLMSLLSGINEEVCNG